ncbi:hypothetical protein [Pedobacter mendelii]|uniref:Uncharacterized protein n=1 Tax=Pedobacter mendelii TaxID=1908240 RepID=A0ABQ2BI59_9SPHI|nr:hypothetical protein [Pedobacter mendelii]GGI24931.1 hypothetical protein GCM10008119_15120 [Pedobacter mendelii]
MDRFPVNLTSAKCELLDRILQEFQHEEYIKADRVLHIFRGNAILASEYLQLLNQLNLIILIGEAYGHPLPALIGKQSGLEIFLSEGNFMKRLELRKMHEETGKSMIELQKEIMDLRNQLANCREIIAKQEMAMLDMDGELKRLEAGMENDDF